MDSNADNERVIRDMVSKFIQSKPSAGEADIRIAFEDVLKSLAPARTRMTEVLLDKAWISLKKESEKPSSDQTSLTEKFIHLIAGLPEKSFASTKLTEALTDRLWGALPHPPLLYVDDKYQYRQPDGSLNNIMYPDLGKAGTPYVKIVRSERKTPCARPDPGLLFDLLMARGNDNDTRVNDAGISSMLFYHAGILILDTYCTNSKDPNINDTSSYLNLAPLYGNNQAEQSAIRTFKNGEIKPDSFSDKRPLGFPPGISVMLIMYSRFHNYVARTLADINEDGRFSLPSDPSDEAAKSKRDNDLFQVARLVTGGLYVNITLHDYIRAITNISHTESSWTLDPRIESDKVSDGEGTAAAKGLGNQSSCEFNLMYRFHSTISKRDDQWTRDFYASILPGIDPHTASLPLIREGMAKFQQTINPDPSKRTFSGIYRTKDGSFKDADLVKILEESIEDPAGAFGANNVPDIFKFAEIAGILRARKWQVASLNEFRQFLNLKRYDSFEEINPDPYVASTLRKLYGDPENVEMYPGIILESPKPKIDPKMGFYAPETVSEAVLTDIVKLVRSDRFLTSDYTPANLTNWGITEVTQDYQTLGGSKISHLILNAFPHWFKFNSVYAMQPFFTPTESRNIFAGSDKADLYVFDPPSFDPPPAPIAIHATMQEFLSQASLRDIYGEKLTSLGEFMCVADYETAHALLTTSVPPRDEKVLPLFKYIIGKTIKLLLQKASYELGKHSVYQMDLVKEKIPSLIRGSWLTEYMAHSVTNLLPIHIMSPVFHLPYRSSFNPGGSYSDTQLYNILRDLAVYLFSDTDPTKSWASRRNVASSIGKLYGMVRDKIAALEPVDTSTILPHPDLLGSYLNKDIMLQVSENPQLLGDITVVTLQIACVFVLSTGAEMAQLIDFYLCEENENHWAEIQRLSRQDTPEADSSLRRYILEGMRLTDSRVILRDVKRDFDHSVRFSHNSRNRYALQKGMKVSLNFAATSRDPEAFPDPLEIQLDRPLELYDIFDEGLYGHFGQKIRMMQNLEFLKILAGLKNLRRTPGDEGKLKYVTKPGRSRAYMTPDWSQFTPYPTTMKFMFDGPPP